MRLMAKAYDLSKDEKYKESFLKGFEFLKKLQYPTGGFAQVYPRRGNYSDYVTLNDNAMANVMLLLDDITEKKVPFVEIVTDAQRAELKEMFNKGIDYLIKSQISINGVKTAWCAQHDPVTYEPKNARTYELASISGSESVGVINLLMQQTDNVEAVNAGQAAINWFSTKMMKDTGFSNTRTDYFYSKPGTNTWYRFYDLVEGKGFFCDRDGSVHYDLWEISDERRTGYSWAGTWPDNVIKKYGITN